MKTTPVNGANDDERKERERIQLAVIVKKTKLRASSSVLVTYIQLHAGFKAQL
jgi:hypothetical protein